MSSSYQPEFMLLIRPVVHTKLTPSAECAVRYQKALLTFCLLCSSAVIMGGAQTVVRVRKCSSILGCSCLRRTRFRSRQQGRRTICRPQRDEGVGCGNELSMVGTIARRRILRRRRSNNHNGGSLSNSTQATRSYC